MAYILKYKDKEENLNKEIRFPDKQSAGLNADKLMQYGHTEVKVEDSFQGNYVGVVIKIVGCLIIIAGAVAGIVQGKQIGNMLTGHFNFNAAFSWWARSIVAGVIIIGLAEIINLLDGIKKQMKS